MITWVAVPFLMLAVACPHVLDPDSERRAVHPVVVLNPGGRTAALMPGRLRGRHIPCPRAVS
jgi:hypothetical protein